MTAYLLRYRNTQH